jgi:RNA polymerase sigma-70 factor (ECF subfamily)
MDTSDSVPVPLSDATAGWVLRAEREHGAALRRYASRLLHDDARADDLVQETLLALGRRSGAELEELRPRLAAWLFTVCRRKALNALRADARLRPLEEAPPSVAPEADPAAALLHREDHGRLLALVARLPGRQREVVRLRYQEGFSYQEIAEITAASGNHVGVLLHEALAGLRREWRRAPG